MIVTVQHAWCKRPECYVEKMFLMPAARIWRVATLVVAALNSPGSFAARIFASHGRMKQIRAAYANLFRKFDFTGCSPVLIRSL